MFGRALIVSLATCLTLDTTSSTQVSQTLSKMTANLVTYYVPGKTASDGTIYPNSSPGPDGFQWYEGGIMWGAIMEYSRLTGDLQYVPTVVDALSQASFGKTGSFLGEIPSLAQTLQGKWNDDIAWWALPVLTSSQIYGPSASLPGGVSLLELSNTTFYQIISQWSDTCYGGIYWSRDRLNAQYKGYKSTITNAQAIQIAAQLYLVTKKQVYVDYIYKIYGWLKQTGIVSYDYKVYDGLTEPQCTINYNQLSYKAGVLAGALSWAFKTNGDTYFINEANMITKKALETFTSNGVIKDPCEPQCDENKVSPKGVMLRGLGYVLEFSNDGYVKQILTDVMKRSVTAMLGKCGDKYACGNYWADGIVLPSNVHYQINAVELMTAYLKSMKKVQDEWNVKIDDGPVQNPSSASMRVVSYSWVVGLSVTVLVL